MKLKYSIHAIKQHTYPMWPRVSYSSSGIQLERNRKSTNKVDYDECSTQKNYTV